MARLLRSVSPKQRDSAAGKRSDDAPRGRPAPFSGADDVDDDNAADNEVRSVPSMSPTTMRRTPPPTTTEGFKSATKQKPKGKPPFKAKSKPEKAKLQ
ncbi:hypothetical protein H6P81_013106 [Aristolochia fimbriata]|uniref:Uncharacterized protein n=1 Tax=Aristolochia fimbriata TaxID=158543 RepID=A0AAV7EDS1_ARIFI|nr:hypothetical protein H6P81_013106 [Aristolochia fimbriata]